MCIHDPTYSDLDCLYSPSHHTEETQTKDGAIEQFVSVLSESYAENKKKFTVHEDIPYGENESSKIDIWGEESDKVLVMIHGGYWQEGDRKYCTTVVPRFVERGVTVAIPGYGLGSKDRPLSVLIDDLVEAIKKLFDLYPKAKFVLCGHSAGGHLAYKIQSILKSERIVGLVLFASVFKLEELVETYIGRGICLTSEEAKKSSCYSEELTGVKSRIVMLQAEHDAPKLQEQNGEMFSELKEQGVDVTREIIPTMNHFTIIEKIAEESVQTKILLQTLEAL